MVKNGQESLNKATKLASAINSFNLDQHGLNT